MKRALVLSSGAAWGAFHIGALEYLVAERAYHFDICAGTGIGAMNAAFVACGEFAALNKFWSRIGWLKLISFNWKHPFRDGLFTGKPQKKFIQKHLSVEKLRKNNQTLVFSTLNLCTGKQIYFTYPGSDTPFADALMGATTVPGLVPPFNYTNEPLVEGTFVNSFILDHIITNFEADEYFGIAALPTGKAKYEKNHKYTHWREALTRTLQINLARDIYKGIENGNNKIKTVRCYQQLIENIESKISDEVKDEDVRQKILNRINRHFTDTKNAFIRESNPKLYEIVSEKEVESPLWSFRKKNIRLLQEQGYKTAKKLTS